MTTTPADSTAVPMLCAMCGHPITDSVTVWVNARAYHAQCLARAEPSSETYWRERAEKAEAERDAALRALRAMLLSADASWEEADAGHDWRQACDEARKVIRSQGKSQ